MMVAERRERDEGAARRGGVDAGRDPRQQVRGISRRKNDKRAEKRNCTSDEASTRVPSSGSPPATMAAAETPMNAPDVPM